MCTIYYLTETGDGGSGTLFSAGGRGGNVGSGNNADKIDLRGKDLSQS